MRSPKPRAVGREQPGRADDEAAADLEDHDHGRPAPPSTHAKRGVVAAVARPTRPAVARLRQAERQAVTSARRRGSRRSTADQAQRRPQGRRRPSAAAAAGPARTTAASATSEQRDADRRTAPASAARAARRRVAHLTRPIVVSTSFTRAWSAFRNAAIGVGVQVGVVPAARLQDLGPLVRLDRLVDRVARAPSSAPRVMPGPATMPRQLTSSTSSPCSFSVGTSTPAMRLPVEIAERAQLAGLDLALELVVAGDAGRDAATQHLGERLAAARERHVVQLGRIAAGGLGDQAGQDVVGAARGAAGPDDLRGVGLQRGGEILHRLVRRIRRHHDDERIAGEAGDRRDGAEVDRRLVGQDRRRPS